MTIQTYIFPNGFRIIHEKPKNNLPISSVQLFCDVGSVHEDDSVRGASHFIEHMCFKGTKKFPKSKDILIQFDRIGADFNAYTDKRLTCYHVKCGDDYVKNSIHLISDMLMNSTFVKNEYNKEYKVVVEENIKNENDPDVILEENLDKLLYKGSSYEFEIDNLRYHKKRLDYNAVLEYYHSFYIPSRFVLSINTNISFDTIQQIVLKSQFMKKKSIFIDDLNKRTISFVITPQLKPQYYLHKKTGIITNLVSIGFRTCPHSSKDKYALNLLKKMLNGLSGRLSMILREENGLTYSSHADTDYYEHLGDFILSAETDYKKLIKNGSGKGVLPLLIDLICNLKKNGVSDEELSVAKNSKRETMNLKLEDCYNAAEHNGKDYLIYGHSKQIIPYDKIYETCYKNITKKDIHEVACKYFKPECMSICIVGETLPSQSMVEKICNHI
jgi:predicted Zn-dependent peptidase